jgi:hypothetical protein
VIQFVKHYDGGVHDVTDDHPAVVQAEKHEGGWRFARPGEVLAMYRIHSGLAEGSPEELRQWARDQGAEIPAGVFPGEKKPRTEEPLPEPAETKANEPEADDDEDDSDDRPLSSGGRVRRRVKT